jgi:hypothetical protein
MYLINVLVNDIHGSKILYFFNSAKSSTDKGENRDQGTEIRDQGSEIRDQGSESRDQRAGIREQGSESREQESEINNIKYLSLF